MVSYLVLALSLLTFLMVASVILWMVLRKPKKEDTEVIMDNIDSVRESVWDHAKHTALEHKTQAENMKVLSGRTQWLVANYIAEKEGDIREWKAREDAAPTLKESDDKH